MFAIISDIHGNLEALEAVLADIARRPVSAIYCLGDIVGYGPNPIECLDHAMKWDVVVMGNFDHAATTIPVAYPESAMRSFNHLWQRLGHRPGDSPERIPQLRFLATRPAIHREDNLSFVHGSPRNPLHEYLFPEAIYTASKMAENAARIERYCFCGHTHIPGVFVEPETIDTLWEYRSLEECNHFWRFDGRKTIVNVGSVGQPRDGDPRACYVTVDGWDVFFHRVEYDWQKTRDKIYAIPDIDNFLGDRLGEGR